MCLWLVYVFFGLYIAVPSSSFHVRRNRINDSWSNNEQDIIRKNNDNKSKYHNVMRVMFEDDDSLGSDLKFRTNNPSSTPPSSSPSKTPSKTPSINPTITKVENSSIGGNNWYLVDLDELLEFEFISSITTVSGFRATLSNTQQNYITYKLIQTLHDFFRNFEDDEAFSSLYFQVGYPFKHLSTEESKYQVGLTCFIKKSNERNRNSVQHTNPDDLYNQIIVSKLQDFFSLDSSMTMIKSLLERSNLSIWQHYTISEIRLSSLISPTASNYDVDGSNSSEQNEDSKLSSTDSSSVTYTAFIITSACVFSIIITTTFVWFMNHKKFHENVLKKSKSCNDDFKPLSDEVSFGTFISVGKRNTKKDREIDPERCNQSESQKLYSTNIPDPNKTNLLQKREESIYNEKMDHMTMISARKNILNKTRDSKVRNDSAGKSSSEKVAHHQYLSSALSVSTLLASLATDTSRSVSSSKRQGSKKSTDDNSFDENIVGVKFLPSSVSAVNNNNLMNNICCHDKIENSTTKDKHNDNIAIPNNEIRSPMHVPSGIDGEDIRDDAENGANNYYDRDDDMTDVSSMWDSMSQQMDEKYFSDLAAIKAHKLELQRRFHKEESEARENEDKKREKEREQEERREKEKKEKEQQEKLRQEEEQKRLLKPREEDLLKIKQHQQQLYQKQKQQEQNQQEKKQEKEQDQKQPNDENDVQDKLKEELTFSYISSVSTDSAFSFGDSTNSDSFTSGSSNHDSSSSLHQNDTTSTFNYSTNTRCMKNTQNRTKNIIPTISENNKESRNKTSMVTKQQKQECQREDDGDDRIDLTLRESNKISPVSPVDTRDDEINSTPLKKDNMKTRGQILKEINNKKKHSQELYKKLKKSDETHRKIDDNKYSSLIFENRKSKPEDKYVENDNVSETTSISGDINRKKESFTLYQIAQNAEKIDAVADILSVD